jgi:hypothetical protein
MLTLGAIDFGRAHEMGHQMEVTLADMQPRRTLIITFSFRDCHRRRYALYSYTIL